MFQQRDSISKPSHWGPTDLATDLLYVFDGMVGMGTWQGDLSTSLAGSGDGNESSGFLLPPVQEETPVPEEIKPPQPVITYGVIQGQATHYGESYNGGTLGCGTGVYSSDNPTIVAVGPARYQEWPCGTQLKVCGPGGCAIVIRQDACPGCWANLIDLSEAANRLVCGIPEHTCSVTIERVR